MKAYVYKNYGREEFYFILNFERNKMPLFKYSTFLF